MNLQMINQQPTLIIPKIKRKKTVKFNDDVPDEDFLLYNSITDEREATEIYHSKYDFREQIKSEGWVN